MVTGIEHIPSASEKDVSTGHLMSPVNLVGVELSVAGENLELLTCDS